MVSGNDAAVALAESVGNDIQNFSCMMNQKALDIGLDSSHFVTPHGLDQDEHYTTAFELAKIADYALNNDTFSKIVRTSNYTININNNPKNLHNTNELLGVLDGVYGVKTGFTNGANRCLVSACKRGKLDIICVVLGCDTKKDRTLDSIKLINYIFDNFSVIDVGDVINTNFDIWVKQKSRSILINKGKFSDLNLCLDDKQIKFKSIAVKNDSSKNVNTFIDFNRNLNAPLVENSVVGVLTVNVNGLDYFSVDILNRNYIEKKSVFNYIFSFLEDYFNYFEM